MAETEKTALEIATTIAAWWGAIIATAVLVWDVVKWIWSGPRIHLEAQGGMAIVGSNMPPDDRTYIRVGIQNRGRAPTTVSGLGAFTYSSRFNRFRKNSEHGFVIILPAFVEPLPKRLEPGEEWKGAFEQNGVIESALSSGVVEVIVSASHTDKPIRAEVRSFPKTKQGEDDEGEKKTPTEA
jgi:hypothetical protein